MSDEEIPLSEEAKEVRAAELYSEDHTFESIRSELGVSRSYAQELVRRGISRLIEEEKVDNPQEANNPIIHNNPVSFEQPPISDSVSIIESLDEGDVDLGRALNKTLIETSMPIMRKVVLNPKIYLLFDYVVAKLGFNGDIGDFLCDTVDYFFASHGIEVSITQKTEVPRYA